MSIRLKPCLELPTRKKVKRAQQNLSDSAEVKTHTGGSHRHISVALNYMHLQAYGLRFDIQKKNFKCSKDNLY